MRRPHHSVHLAALAAAATALTALTAPALHAAEPLPLGPQNPPFVVTAPPTLVSAPTCVVRGTNPVPKGTPIYDAQRGGNVIATLSGVLAPLTLTALPQTDRSARAKVSTSAGSPAFRIDGYLDPSQLTFYTTRDIPVVGTHLAIAAGQHARFVGATADAILIEHDILGADNQKLAVSAPCDALSLSPVRPVFPPDPIDARGWRMRVPTLDLYDRPNGRVVYSLMLREGGTLLFWGRESRAGFTHVQGRSDVVIDAWVKRRSLEAMQPGELMTPYVPQPPAGQIIGLEGGPPVIIAKGDIPVRLNPEPESPVIGFIEAGAELHTFSYVEGWAIVLPKSLVVRAAQGASFWVPEADVMP